MLVHYAVRVTETTEHSSRALITASGAQESPSPEALRAEITRDMHILYPQQPGKLIAVSVHTHELLPPTNIYDGQGSKA